MGDLSAHFSRREFDCHDGSRAHPVPALIDALERLRSLVGGKPLTVISGYRSPSYNRQVGGAPRSQHLVNRAADIVAGYATIDQARAAGFTGIGYNRRRQVVHVDVRTGRHAEFLDV